MQLEDYGFCKRGEGGPFVESGALAWQGGSLPTNTHGGSLSEAYIHGLNHVVEGVRALRGDSTSPVEGAEVCLVTSAACVPSSALLLGRQMSERFFPDTMPSPLGGRDHAAVVAGGVRAPARRAALQRVRAHAAAARADLSRVPLGGADVAGGLGRGEVYTYTSCTARSRRVSRCRP